MKVLRTIKDKITSLDPNPAYPQIAYRGISSKKNFFGGLCGISFIILGVVLVCLKAINVFEKQRLTLSTFVQRDMSQLQMEDLDVAFYLSMRTSAGFVDIPYQFYPLFGVDVMVVEIYYNFTDHTKQLNKYQLTPCDDEDQSVVCAKGLKYRPLCSLDYIDEEICPGIREYDVLVLPCNRANPFCNKTLADGLLPILFLKDNKYDVLNKNTKKLFQETITNVNAAPWLLYLEQGESIMYQVPVTKIVVQSDQSIWPTTIQALSAVNHTETFFYPKQDIIPTNRIRFLNVYMDFYIHRSPFTQSYHRSFYRFDSMLGQVFGLLGWLGLIASCFCAGYNRWSMKRYITAHLKQNTEDQQTKKNGGYCTYLKNQVTKICTCEDVEYQKPIDLLQMNKNLNKIMEIMGKQKFIQNLQYTYSNPTVSKNQAQDLKQSMQKIEELKKSLLQSSDANLSQKQ